MEVVGKGKRTWKAQGLSEPSEWRGAVGLWPTVDQTVWIRRPLPHRWCPTCLNGPQHGLWATHLNSYPISTLISSVALSKLVSLSVLFYLPDKKFSLTSCHEDNNV